MSVQIKTGSATAPQPENGRGILIAHICNDKGAFGAGFVLAINKISAAGKGAYQGWAKDYNMEIPRGLVQIVELKPNVFVANMIAQRLKPVDSETCLVDYPALEKCLAVVFNRAIQLNCDVHIPAGIGSGLAGGDRDLIHQMIRTQDQLSGFPKLQSQETSVTLWEYTDTNSDSFVAPSPHPVSKNDPTAVVTQSVPDSILDDPTESDL